MGGEPLTSTFNARRNPGRRAACILLRARPPLAGRSTVNAPIGGGNIDNSWSRLMDAPWGKFTPQAIGAKQAALVRYKKSFEEWKRKRIAAGKWLTKRLEWK